MQTKNLSDWQRAFGKSDAEKVVQVLCEAWRELVRDSAQTFHGKEKEHTLTDLLGEYIRTAKTGAGLTGNWTYEDRLGSIARVGSITFVSQQSAAMSDVSWYRSKNRQHHGG
ncbi:hypothetical protein WT01_32285 [Burkholderia cepacia]|uniref:hypothetical protein n=1 Tax=Burkholderia cepacia TaxID=292 RepID=UPI00075AA3A7|nr:hypothetical protein [Burkholderia cepacia]KVH35642.1 hypothetical protein WS88_17450 [Burkholderia cepacia]KVL49666.1 hypothetical protein WT01_32285 [Burkholderia cepacia]